MTNFEITNFDFCLPVLINGLLPQWGKSQKVERYEDCAFYVENSKNNCCRCFGTVSVRNNSEYQTVHRFVGVYGRYHTYRKSLPDKNGLRF